MATQILENIPETISIEKQLINQSMTTTLEQGLEMEAAHVTSFLSAMWTLSFPLCMTSRLATRAA